MLSLITIFFLNRITAKISNATWFYDQTVPLLFTDGSG